MVGGVKKVVIISKCSLIALIFADQIPQNYRNVIIRSQHKATKRILTEFAL